MPGAEEDFEIVGGTDVDGFVGAPQNVNMKCFCRHVLNPFDLSDPVLRLAAIAQDRSFDAAVLYYYGHRNGGGGTLGIRRHRVYDPRLFFPKLKRLTPILP